MQERSFLVQVLLDMATGGGAKLEPLIVDKAGVFDAGLNKGYNPVTVAGGDTTVLAEKGAVSNHAVVITPEARISAGWQDGKSVTGDGIGVSASELVSGTYSVSQAGSADVTNYKNVSVKSGGTVASFEKETVDAHTVRFTPKATVTQGWQDSGVVSGESVDVNAGELVSGTYPVTASGEFDVSAYEKISVPSGVVAASASKGIVAGHTVTVTPKASRTAGYISSGETEGLGVNVTASELVSGTLNVSQSGTQDVTNYESVNVPSGGHSASATKGAVSNHSVTVTPKSTATGGFVGAGEVSGAPISVSASELVSGTLNVSQSGTQDVTNYKNVSVPSGGHSASATKGAVSNHSVSITPKSTATAGFVSASDVTGTPVSVSAIELVSGTFIPSGNGVFDVSNYKYVEVTGMISSKLLATSTTTVSTSSSWKVGATLNLTQSDIQAYSLFIVKITPITVSGYTSINILSGTHYSGVPHSNGNFDTNSTAPLCFIVPINNVTTTSKSCSSLNTDSTFSINIQPTFNVYVTGSSGNTFEARYEIYGLNLV